MKRQNTNEGLEIFQIYVAHLASCSWRIGRIIGSVNFYWLYSNEKIQKIDLAVDKTSITAQMQYDNLSIFRPIVGCILQHI